MDVLFMYFDVYNKLVNFFTITYCHCLLFLNLTVKNDSLENYVISMKLKRKLYFMYIQFESILHSLLLMLICYRQ